MRGLILSLALVLTAHGQSVSISAPVFSPSGRNDATSGGKYSGSGFHTYQVLIDSTGTPNTFKWRKDTGAYTTGVAITGTAQPLTDGVTIAFGATTGHVLAAAWTISESSGVIGAATRSDLNDISAAIAAGSTAPDSATFRVFISRAGATDFFQWSKNGGEVSAAIPITGSPQALSDGVKVIFAAIRGHVFGDSWIITANQSTERARFRRVEDKVRDVISLKDFMRSDGVVDNVGFRNAINAVTGKSPALPGTLPYSSHLYLPPGKYAIDQPQVISNAFGIGIYGDGDQSQIIWMGQAPGTDKTITAALTLMGVVDPTLRDFSIIIPPNHTLDAGIRLLQKNNRNDPGYTSAHANIERVLIDSEDLHNLAVGVLVDGGGDDLNNDYNHFTRLTTTGTTEAGIWMRGSQSYSNRIDMSLIGGFSTDPADGRTFFMSKYLVKATALNGGRVASASYLGGFITYTLTAWHNLADGQSTNITGALNNNYNRTACSAVIVDKKTFKCAVSRDPGPYTGTYNGTYSKTDGGPYQPLVTGSGGSGGAAVSACMEAAATVMWPITSSTDTLAGLMCSAVSTMRVPGSCCWPFRVPQEISPSSTADGRGNVVPSSNSITIRTPILSKYRAGR